MNNTMSQTSATEKVEINEENKIAEAVDLLQLEVSKADEIFKQLENELNLTNQKIEELKQLRESQTKDVDELQNSFVFGKVSTEELQAAQNKLSVFDSSIKSLTEKRDLLKEKAEHSRNDSILKSDLLKAQDQALSIKTSMAELNWLRDEFRDQMKNFAVQAVKKLTEFRSGQAELKNILQSLNNVNNFVSAHSSINDLIDLHIHLL